MIYMPQGIYDLIIQHSRQEFPHEACGLLIGNGQRVERTMPMTNVDHSPESYTMDSIEQLKAMKEIRNTNQELVGIYHSHVASQAYPSAKDVEWAFYPAASFVIVSLKEKDKPVIRSFKINNGEISEEEVCIE